MIRKQLANILTISRGIAAIFLLHFPVFGFPFWILYGWCGVSDVLDGFIARKTGSANERGAMLDSIADFIFVGIWLWKIIPIITLPTWLWIWIFLIAIIKIAVFALRSLRQHQFAMPHSIANKVTGVMLFFLPIAMQFMSTTIPSIAVCAVASWAVVGELRLLKSESTKIQLEEI